MYLCHLPLATAYIMLMSDVKMQLFKQSVKSGLARSLYKFLQGAGGFGNGFKSIPLNWKDVVIFIPIVIIVSIIVTLIIAAVKKFIAKPLYARYKQKLAEQAIKEETTL
jgi:uncharacterized membrane protein AbrB (regulator of aidB expression)